MKKSLQINFDEFESTSELSPSDAERFVRLEEHLNNAYAPYSNFKVAALLLLEDGSEWLGTNQENIAYPSGMCAERVVLFYVGSRCPDKKIEKMYLMAKGGLIEESVPIMPCGACRQVMVECKVRQKQDFSVYMKSQNDRVVRFNSVEDLLPFSFRDV